MQKQLKTAEELNQMAESHRCHAERLDIAAQIIRGVMALPDSETKSPR